ncbi:MAG: LysM peptidoglycan-binding domain-containing protein [Chloroflexota bacterium]|nr:LysM peptidoglycan-binding domain-containing protein [Chloroflexota bacterium]
MPRLMLRLIAVLATYTLVGVSLVYAQAQERPDGSLVYVVQAGDTVDGIAFAYGATRADIMALNNMTDPRLIQIGQTLIIRAAVSADESSAPEAPADGAASDAAALPELGDGGAGAAQSPARSPLDDPAGVPPAPIIGAAAGVLPALDPAATTAQVCIELFDDVNQNRIRDGGEAPLTGGQLTLLDAAGVTVRTFETGAGGDLACVEALTPGAYTANAGAPPDYALTTPDGLRVDAHPGADVRIAFGAARGATVLPAPTFDIEAVIVESPADVSAPTSRAPQTTTNLVRDNLGLIAFGLAGIVLIGGMGAALLLRRRDE